MRLGSIVLATVSAPALLAGGAAHGQALPALDTTALRVATPQTTTPPSAGVETQADQLAADEPGAEIVVTGNVAGSREPSVAITVLDAATLRQTAPLSGVDMLKNVPGVFVNSGLGETRNIVYSRGVSANSTDGASGYYYVSLQEDGLPVTNITASNYGPDLYFRPDLSLARVEALRGGTAVVTGPNAPGGIFNYISKDGKSAPGSEASARLGLLGNGRNPYVRVDAYTGGRLGGSDLYYTVSGFYRWDRGARDPGYAANRGGQIRANLLFDNDTTRVKVSGKYLNDRNLFYLFLPARDFRDPKVVPELSNSDSLIIGPNPHTSIPYAGGQTRSYDASNLPFHRQVALGVDFEHDFGDGLKFKNQLKVNHNKTIQNTGTVQFVVSLLDPTLTSFLHTDRVGTYNLTDKRGALLAQIVRTAAGTAASGASVTVNNLPNQSVLNPGVIGLAAFDTTYDAREVMDQFAVSKSWDRLSMRVGGFFAQSKFNTLQGAAGAAVEPIVPQPETIGITLTTPAGIVQQVTTPEGFASIGQRAGGTQIYDKQTQISAFGGANWELVQGLSLDAGIRYEHIQMRGVNTPEVGNPLSSDPTYGGLDGNPNTLYDNYVVSLGTPVRFRYNLDFMSYSGALTYRLGSGASVFVRFSQGQKAPDGITYATLDNPQKVALLNPTPQRIQQAEVGFKLSRRNLNVSVNPFYSRLSKVSTIQNFTNPDGSLYTNPPLYSELKTIGVEIEGDVSAFDIFNLRTAITIQDPKSKDFRIYVANGAGPADDTITQVPDGEAENNPKVQATTTLQVTPNEHITSFLTWKYLGKRAANRYNAFYLPSFSQYDIGATYTFDDHFSVSFTINNLFDREGVVSYVLAGGFVSALDRQSLTPAQVSANPNQLFAILPIQPRSMFVSGSFKF